jgi:uncharacterized LabA/DUF88 family protein
MLAKKTAIFVDVVNQFYANDSVRLDYERYLDEARQGAEVFRAFCYGAQMNEEAEPFLSMMRQIGFETRYRRAVVIGDRRDIFRTDRNMALAMDVWRLCPRVDAVVIGSNDPELVPLVDRLRETGVQVGVLSCRVGPELSYAADWWAEFDYATAAAPAPFLGAREPVGLRACERGTG